MKKLSLILAIFFAGSILLNAGTIIKPNTFSTGQTIEAADFNTNFDTIYNEFNGSIDASNIATDGVQTSEIQNDAVTPAKVDEDNTDPFIINLLQTTSTGTFAIANLTTIENSPTFTFGYSASTMTITSTATITTLDITTISNSPTFTYGLSASTITVTTATLTTANITTINNSPVFTYGITIATITSSGSEVDFSTHVAIPSLARYYYDGGGTSGNTYSTEGSADRIDFYGGGNTAISIHGTSLVIKALSKVYVDGVSGEGSNTYFFEEAGDQIRFVCNGVNSILMSETNFTSPAGIIIGNESLNNKIDDSSNGSGSTVLYIGNNTIDTTVVSSSMTKQNIMNTSQGLTEILALKVKDYNYKEGFSVDTTTVHTGLLAEEVELVFSNAVITRSDGYKAVKQKELIPLLIKSIQELEARIEVLETP